MPRVINIQNARALVVPQVNAFIKRAVSSVDFAAPGGPDSVAEDIFTHVTSPNMFLLLGMEQGEPKSMALGFFPSSALFPYPVVSLIYNEGSREMLRMTVNTVCDVITEQGYSKAWAINGTGKNDTAWSKLLSPDDGSAETIGSVIEISVN